MICPFCQIECTYNSHFIGYDYECCDNCNSDFERDGSNTTTYWLRQDPYTVEVSLESSTIIIAKPLKPMLIQDKHKIITLNSTEQPTPTSVKVWLERILKLKAFF